MFGLLPEQSQLLVGLPTAGESSFIEREDCFGDRLAIEVADWDPSNIAAVASLGRNTTVADSGRSTAVAATGHMGFEAS